jgi:hypothetical protein
MEIQRREGYKKTMSGIQAKICLPPSRPSLTRYALETRGALRMIRVSIFLNDFMPHGGGLGSPYIAQRVQHEPLDQTDLRNSVDTTLGGGKGTSRRCWCVGPIGDRATCMEVASLPHQWRAS